MAGDMCSFIQAALLESPLDACSGSRDLGEDWVVERGGGQHVNGRFQGHRRGSGLGNQPPPWAAI